MIKLYGIPYCKSFCTEDETDAIYYRKSINKSNLLEFINIIEPYFYQKGRLQFRSERSFFNIFTNDREVYDKLCHELKKYLRAIHEPKNDQEIKFLQEKHNKILCNHIPYKKYNYKIHIKNNIPLSFKEKFKIWISHYDKIYAPFTVKEWLSSSYNVYFQRPYVYAEDQPTLTMISLFLGDYLKKTEQFVVRSGINI